MAENLDVLNTAVSLLIRAMLLAARFYGWLRLRTEDPSRKSGGQNGSFNDQRNSIGDHIQVLVHKAIQTSSRTRKASCRGSIIA